MTCGVDEGGGGWGEQGCGCVDDEGVGGCAVGGGGEEVGVGAGFDDDEQAGLAGPGDEAGDGAGRAVGGGGDLGVGESGDEAGVPVHVPDDAVQHRGPGVALVGAPVLVVDEPGHQAQGLLLGGEDPMVQGDEVAPPGVGLETAPETCRGTGAAAS
ncbi:hypothetical protein AFB00_30260 (plasmid) [Pseudonocardia sp. HH130630-07]|nr:hypothetical protein AFB00_30260 [Pseudonocardia sp. HH130630-07]